MDRGAWRATVHGVKESDTTEVTQQAAGWMGTAKDARCMMWSGSGLAIFGPALEKGTLSPRKAQHSF